MKYLLLLLIPLNVWADQISIQESSLVNQDDTYYTSSDRRMQYDFGEEKYLFLQYRRAGTCPYYCGFNYDMYGVGFGRKFKLDNVTFFAQAGYYKVDNDYGFKREDEVLYSYLNARFKSLDNPKHFEAYEIRNDDAYGVTIGIDIPVFDKSGIKLSYQYMKIKEVISGHLDYPPEALQVWWDPRNRDFSTISAGFYYNF